MASILKVDTLTGVTTAGSISVTGEGNSTTTNLQQGLAKAWAKYQGSGTVAFYDSFGCTSISDDAQGRYSVTLTNAFSSSNYALAGEDDAGEMFIENASANTTTTFNTTHTTASGGSFQDPPNIGVITMGDLA